MSRPTINEQEQQMDIFHRSYTNYYNQHVKSGGGSGERCGFRRGIP